MRRALARFLLGLVLRLEGVAERLDPQGYPKTIEVERRGASAPVGGYRGSAPKRPLKRPSSPGASSR